MSSAPPASPGRNGAAVAAGVAAPGALRSDWPRADARLGWIVALLCLPVVACAALALGGRSWEAVVLCTLAIAACVPVALPWLARKPFDLFHPMAFVTLSVLLGTTLRSLYVALLETEHTHWLLEEQPLSTLLPGAVVLCAATTCIGAGYWAAGRRRVRLERIAILDRTWSFPRLRTILWCVAPIAAIATVDFLRRTGFHLDALSDLSAKRRVVVDETTRDFASLGYHRWAAHALVVPVFYMFLVLWLMRREPRARFYALLAFGVAAVFPILVSDRSGLGYLLIALMMAADRLGRLKYRQVALVGTGLLLVFGVMRGLRDESMQDASYFSRIVGEGKMFEDLVANRNFTCITKTAKIYEYTPERMPREYGQTLLLWTVAWIPRTIWTGKPEISLGDRVQHEIYQDPIGGGYPPGIVGELLINFGLLGTLVGCLVFGAFLRFFYNSFLPTLRDNPTLLLLYISVVVEVSFVMMGLQVARVIMDLLKILVTTGAFLFLASVRRPRAATAGAPRLRSLEGLA